MRPYSRLPKSDFVRLSDDWAGFSVIRYDQVGGNRFARQPRPTIPDPFLRRPKTTLKNRGILGFLRRVGRARGTGGWSVLISPIERINSLISGGGSVFLDLIAREKLFQLQLNPASAEHHR